MRIILTVLLNAVALMLTAYIVPGFMVSDFKTAVLAGIVIGLINTFVKPLLVVLTLPITIVTLGLFLFVINAIVLWIAAAIVPGLGISGWMPAILAAIVLSVLTTGLSMMAKEIEPAKGRKK